VEITIGVQNVARELVVETDQTADEVAKAVAKAINAGVPLELTDTRGRRIIVPAGTVGYVEIGDEVRKIGFHSL
jgi:phage tail sheath gpL-like